MKVKKIRKVKENEKKMVQDNADSIRKTEL